MSIRDTGTGDVLEKMVIPSLERGGYEFEVRKNIGVRPSGRKHIVDAIATKNNESALISLKWQEVSGTVEQKIPFEVICLLKALKDNKGKFQRAYLVLGGPGWTLRTFYVQGGLKPYIVDAERVNIIAFEDFIYLSNRGKL